MLIQLITIYYKYEFNSVDMHTGKEVPIGSWEITVCTTKSEHT